MSALNSDRFVDCSPRQRWATLLDEGVYLGSWRTMYRLLQQRHQVRERRNVRRHPKYVRPELAASGPNQGWTWDITYRKGCEQANRLLFSVGNAEAIDAACRRAAVGHLVDNALLIRSDALDALEPALRVYEGCARAWLGTIEGANVIKLHRYSGKVSYLVCPALDHDPNPVVSLHVKVDLPNLAIDGFDYSQWSDPPRLGIDPVLLSPSC